MTSKAILLPPALAASITATLVLALSSSLAGADPGSNYRPLIESLNNKKRHALSEAEEAQLLIAGYQEFLADPELNSDERPELRKSLIKERARYKEHRAQAGRIQVAIRELQRLPNDQHVTLSSLQEAYTGLDLLATRGKAAWDEVLENRERFVKNLEREHEEHMRNAQSALRKLDAKEQTTRLLLNAVNPDVRDSSDGEFFVALKLPAIRSAVERGFRITSDPKDPKRQAQTTLIALIAYSQYFWDHYGGARTLLTEEEFPSDRRRNIFGVPDGKVLASDMISHNNSHFYYLAPKARESFNARLEMIWNEEAVTVTTWNQKYDGQFVQACKGLATVSDEYLVPNPQVFALLEKIELLLNELDSVHKSIEHLDSSYEQQLAKAKQFGEEARLSSAHYNAEIWSRESKQLLRGFEKSTTLLSQQLKASSESAWNPNARGISTSALIIAKAQKRFYAVRKVKTELRKLLAP
ncbi:MAG: hypothetical protein MK194_10625 [Roseibacillus sp.]|nr:hypothetical protein [Roseibacillus sp.]